MLPTHVALRRPTHSTDNKHATLLAWGLAQGAQSPAASPRRFVNPAHHHRNHHGNAGSGGDYVGLAATGPVSPGDLLLSVPRTMWLTHHTIAGSTGTLGALLRRPAHRRLGVLAALTPDCLLMHGLIAERQQHQQHQQHQHVQPSPWAAYLDILPRSSAAMNLHDDGAPSFGRGRANRARRRWIDTDAAGTTTAATAAAAAAAAGGHGRKIRESYRTCVLPLSLLLPRTDLAFDKGVWQWAYYTVITRAYNVDIDGVGTSALVPVADSMNHRTHSALWRASDGSVTDEGKSGGDGTGGENDGGSSHDEGGGGRSSSSSSSSSDGEDPSTTKTHQRRSSPPPPPTARPGGGTAMLSEDAGSVAVYARDSYEAGDELFNHYGSHSNRHWYSNYGFVEEEDYWGVLPLPLNATDFIQASLELDGVGGIGRADELGRKAEEHIVEETTQGREARARTLASALERLELLQSLIKGKGHKDTARANGNIPQPPSPQARLADSMTTQAVYVDSIVKTAAHSNLAHLFQRYAIRAHTVSPWLVRAARALTLRGAQLRSRGGRRCVRLVHEGRPVGWENECTARKFLHHLLRRRWLQHRNGDDTGNDHGEDGGTHGGSGSGFDTGRHSGKDDGSDSGSADGIRDATVDPASDTPDQAPVHVTGTSTEAAVVKKVEKDAGEAVKAEAVGAVVSARMVDLFERTQRRLALEAMDILAAQIDCLDGGVWSSTQPAQRRARDSSIDVDVGGARGGEAESLNCDTFVGALALDLMETGGCEAEPKEEGADNNEGDDGGTGGGVNSRDNEERRDTPPSHPHSHRGIPPLTQYSSGAPPHATWHGSHLGRVRMWTSRLDAVEAWCAASAERSHREPRPQTHQTPSLPKSSLVACPRWRRLARKSVQTAIEATFVVNEQFGNSHAQSALREYAARRGMHFQWQPTAAQR